jgi:hypothetical protein
MLYSINWKLVLALVSLLVFAATGVSAEEGGGY